ncbi:MAG: hypothetical protein WCF94_00570 [bacterium]
MENIIQKQPTGDLSKKKEPLWIKVLIIIVTLLIVSWGVLEFFNYKEYVTEVNQYEKDRVAFNFLSYMGEPKYSMFVTKVWYQIFPKYNNYEIQPVDKPVIYLYPQSVQDVEVSLKYDGKIFASYPTYNEKTNGWSVRAYPDGQIINIGDGKEYSYLFWEGMPDKKPEYDLSTGFVVRGEDTKAFLQNTLSKIGLTPREYNEFIVYWYPKMQNNKYNLIHFARSEYTNTAHLKTIPEADSTLRVFMVYKPLNEPTKVEPQIFPRFERNGFTLIEWGGSEI